VRNSRHSCSGFPGSSSNNHVSDIHVSFSDIHVCNSLVSASDTPVSVCNTKEEKEKEEEKHQQAKDNGNEEDDNEQTSLSEYDVSMFTASQLFDSVNIPDNLSQYDRKGEEEEDFAPELVWGKPIPRACSEPVSNINDSEGT
jgi:hypothetical protein